MAKCDVCGNNYDKAFQVTTVDGEQHTFDCYECAIHLLAPTCANCGVRVIGHGMESNGSYYCCAHCASKMGIDEMQDRV
jgi:anthranilate phosphoribosyltransferase